MYIKNLNKQNKIIGVAIPLTNGTGKTRIKTRTILNEYGIPVATRTVPFTQSCYVEWQIGYDVLTKDQEKTALTTLTDKTFIGASGDEKYLYELSEYVSYFYKWGVIRKEQLVSIKKYLKKLNHDSFLDVHPDLSIKRTHFIEKEINKFNFLFTQVEYPMLIYKFGNYEVITEISIKEKQHAVGTQPMLYLCFPISELQADKPLFGRIANKQEEATFEISERNISIFLETLKIFGTLTIKHNHDALCIIDVILGE